MRIVAIDTLWRKAPWYNGAEWGKQWRQRYKCFHYFFNNRLHWRHNAHIQIRMLLLCEDFSRILVIFCRIVSNIQHDRTTKARLSRRKNTFSMVGGETCGSFETVTRVSSTFELNGCFKQREHAHENKDQDDVENFLMTRNFFSLASFDCRVGNE